MSREYALAAEIAPLSSEERLRRFQAAERYAHLTYSVSRLRENLAAAKRDLESAIRKTDSRTERKLHKLQQRLLEAEEHAAALHAGIMGTGHLAANVADTYAQSPSQRRMLTEGREKLAVQAEARKLRGLSPSQRHILMGALALSGGEAGGRVSTKRIRERLKAKDIAVSDSAFSRSMLRLDQRGLLERVNHERRLRKSPGHISVVLQTTDIILTDSGLNLARRLVYR